VGPGSWRLRGCLSSAGRFPDVSPSGDGRFEVDLDWPSLREALGAGNMRWLRADFREIAPSFTLTRDLVLQSLSMGHGAAAR